jgi:hypothetical protein
METRLKVGSGSVRALTTEDVAAFEKNKARKGFVVFSKYLKGNIIKNCYMIQVSFRSK